MPGKANVYTLGEFGVNRVKSPVHLVDGELLIAQNAAVPLVMGNRGLQKRPGMGKHNAVAAAGPILSLINVPLPDPFPPPDPPADSSEDWLGGLGTVLHFAFDTVSRASSDGTTWADTSAALNGRTIFQANQGGYITGGRLYYPFDLPPTGIGRFDGTTVETFLSSIPADPEFGTSFGYSAVSGSGPTLYVMADYVGPGATGTGWVVFSVSAAGVATPFCEPFTSHIPPIAGYIGSVTAIRGPVVWNGSVWIAARVGTDTIVYRAAETDTGWTVDHIFVGAPTINPIGCYGGGATSLWIGLRTSSTTGSLYKRTVTGSYVEALAERTNVVYATGDTVYTAGTTALQRSTDDGATFTTFPSGPTDALILSGRGVVFGGTTYLLFASGVYRDDGADVALVDAGPVRWGAGIL